MSLLRWFKAETTSRSTSDEAAMNSADKFISQVVQEELALAGMGRKRKSSKRHCYDDDIRTEIGKHAMRYGNKSAVDKFSRSLGFPLPEATVRNFKRELQSQIKRGEWFDDVHVAVKKRGRPLLLPEEIDVLTKKYIHTLRVNGAPVSSSIIIVAAQGIITHYDQSLLKMFGGSIELKKSWAFSFLKRCGYVKRKATRTARKVPGDFEEVKKAFLQRVSESIQDYNIAPSMVVNFDQTGCKMIPVSDWTLEVEGTKQVDMIGRDDKREITLLLAISLAGKLLPPQIIYAGKTSRCHPSVNVPDRWNITHSTSHWSTEATMIEYCDHVLAPYMVEQRQSLDLGVDAPGLCIFDVFAAHRCEAFLQKLNSCYIKYVFVPAGCTGLLQPLDISVNDPFKSHMKELFSLWYALQVKSSLDRNPEVQAVKVDLKTSTIKPIHFQWLIQNIAWLSKQDEALIRGWKEAGILDCLIQHSQ